MMDRDNVIQTITADDVIARLEEAGAISYAMPNTGYKLHCRTQNFHPLYEPVAATDKNTLRRVRLPLPSAEQISMMDRTYAWLALIPRDKHILRRIVCMRSLMNAATMRHVNNWRSIALAVGADYRAIKTWHAQGISIIVEALRNGSKRPALINH
jgi:hypothetical protein